MRDIFLGLIVFTILFTGCAKTYTEGPTYGEKVVVPSLGGDVIRMDSVAILDSKLQRWELIDKESGSHNTYSKIAVEKQGTRLLSYDNIEVVVMFRNRTDYTQQLEVRTTFFDKDGLAIEKPSSWKRVILSPKSIEQYSEKSISGDKVQHYFVEVKNAS